MHSAAQTLKAATQRYYRLQGAAVLLRRLKDDSEQEFSPMSDEEVDAMNALAAAIAAVRRARVDWKSAGRPSLA